MNIKVARYELKRVLKKLKDIRGRGTQLISVYVTPGYKLSDVNAKLRGEYDQASNIKSKWTRHSVQTSIEKILQHLRLYKQTPENGLAVFCGNYSQTEGDFDIELYHVTPPEPTTVQTYRCDDHFFIDPLEDMIETKEVFGLITIDRQEATIATLKGRNIRIIKKTASGLEGKHKSGGQSARRFERLYAIHTREFMLRVSEEANSILLPMENLKGIIVGGPGPTKNDFLELESLHYELRKKILGIVDIGYADESGIQELVNRSADLLSGVEIVEEKKWVDKFIKEVSTEGLATYGEAEVMKALQLGGVETLLISEKLDIDYITIECMDCGNRIQDRTDRFELIKDDVRKKRCPKCGGQTLTVTEDKDLVETLNGIAEQFGTKVEMISDESAEGQQFWMSFGGLGALLRYKVEN